MDRRRCRAAEASGDQRPLTRPVVDLGPVARCDLDEHVLYSRRQVGSETAARFAAAATATFRDLAGHPGIGSVLPVAAPGVANLHKWRVDGFPKLLIFYRLTSGGIRVIRALHAARDLPALLDA